VQTEKSFLKQNKVFLSTKASARGKAPGKAGTRFWKNVGLGFKTPREAIEGKDICWMCFSNARGLAMCLSIWLDFDPLHPAAPLLDPSHNTVLCFTC
jgi:hypothetical protein